MVSRSTRIGYSFKNVGTVNHTFYVWVYLYDEQNWAWKSGFKYGPTSYAVSPEGTYTEQLSKTVDLTPGHTYRAVVAVYSDSAFQNKLDDDNSSNTVSV